MPVVRYVKKNQKIVDKININGSIPLYIKIYKIIFYEDIYIPVVRYILYSFYPQFLIFYILHTTGVSFFSSFYVFFSFFMYFFVLRWYAIGFGLIKIFYVYPPFPLRYLCFWFIFCMFLNSGIIFSICPPTLGIL